MRKLGLLVTLMVASAFFLAAAPGSASAANCNVAVGSTHNAAGAVRSTVQFSGCTGITAIRVVRDNPDPTPGAHNTGWDDLSIGGWITGGLNQVYPGPASVTINTTTGGGAYVLRWCWYTGTHSVVPYVLFQLKNAAAPFNWGPLNDKIGDQNGTPVPC